ncbi:MAG: hypothetical protein OEQ18_01775 [Gammaproteobacteria bacterium]|nr:hypothetical protein [Gammaproteobacteria bacterium]
MSLISCLISDLDLLWPIDFVYFVGRIERSEIRHQLITTYRPAATPVAAMIPVVHRQEHRCN